MDILDCEMSFLYNICVGLITGFLISLFIISKYNRKSNQQDDTINKYGEVAKRNDVVDL